MPERRDPPPTAEGWYALHDFRTIDWDAWQDADQTTRTRALEEVIDFLDARLALADAEEGDSALYTIVGHEADLLVLHLRPTSAHLGALERQFERTEFARFTERTDSFVSVTEASGYSESARGYFEEDGEVDPGLANYIGTRLEPSIPDATHVCFYPMNKRRDPEYNWYDLPFEDRAEHMHAHGDIGREYGGKVTQMITGAIALDDWEWGVTLWGNDLVDMKDLLYEMRFDPSTSRFAEFGPFYIGRRIPPSDLPAVLAGEAVPTDDESTPSVPDDVGQDGRSVAGGDDGDAVGSETGPDGSAPAPEATPSEEVGDEPSAEPADPEDMQANLASLGLYEGSDYEADQFGLLVYSTADATELADEVDGMRGHFEEYDSHVTTVVRAESGQSVVASLWTTERAADIAAGFLTELPGVTRSLQGPLSKDGTAAAEDHTTTETENQTTTDSEDHTATDSEDIRDRLADLDVYAGQPHGEDIYALVLYSDAPVADLTTEVADLSDGFDRYDTHDGTAVYEDPAGGNTAVVSLWETQSAADTASDHLLELPGVVGWADEGDGFGTMGMFYTVKPDHREDFVEKFEAVGKVLADVEGHRASSLLVNTADENDMFIASQWDSKADAMEFFRSEAFSETVDWGRDVLSDKPRHVFLA